MSDLSNAQLRRLDLTLLLVFLGLLRHRKAAAVAVELGLTQSAISQSLRRLRDIFGDELFLRRPHGMDPTATARALERPVAAAVETLRAAMGAARRFDPQEAEGVLRLAALDAEQAVLIPPLAAHLRRAAPGLRLSVLPQGRGDAVAALGDGRADLALGFIWDPPEAVLGEVLYHDSFLVTGPPALLPGAGGMMDLDGYCAADHVLVSPGGDLRGVVDDRLAALGRSRRIILGLPSFLPALAAAATCGALLTLPAGVAARFAAGFGLATARPPVEVRSFPVSVFRHRRNAGDARCDWVVAALRSLVPEGAVRG